MQRRTVGVLSTAQVIGGLSIGVAGSMGSLLAYEVTGRESLAGLSRVFNALSAALFAGPLVALALRRGRRAALASGWAIALAGSVLLVGSVAFQSLWLLLGGMLLFGAGSAANLQTRFAATDLAVPKHRARTLAFVMWATTFGSVAGPNLAAPGGSVGRWLGLPPIAGAYVLAGVGLLVGSVFVATALRPDPLLLARSHTKEASAASRRRGALSVVPELWRLPAGRFALVTLVLNMYVMAAIMTLTPVHMTRAGHSLAMVGLTLSMHILGMFAFAPLIGWWVERSGSRVVIWACVATNLAALVLCALAGDSLMMVNIGLFLVGLGWSFGMVSGSSILAEEVPVAIRTQSQGAADTLVNVGNATAAGLAGPIMGALGFGGLSMVTMVALVPVVLLGLGRARVVHQVVD